MASRSAQAGWLLASLMVAACSLRGNGLGAGVEQGDDGGGLIGTPGTGGATTGGSNGAATGGSTGSATGGNSGTAGVIGTGGARAADAASASPDLAMPSPDGPVIAPPPPTPPDAASLPPEAGPVALPPDAAPLPPDAAPPPATISCGTSHCLAGSQACCATAAGSSCIPLNGLCLGGSVFRCDGPEDCDNNRVCCLRMEGSGLRSACARPAECTQSGGAAMCRTGADCPGSTRTCSAVSGTISVCR
jgi:hypothetical protein